MKAMEFAFGGPTEEQSICRKSRVHYFFGLLYLGTKTSSESSESLTAIARFFPPDPLTGDGVGRGIISTLWCRHTEKFAAENKVKETYRSSSSVFTTIEEAPSFLIKGTKGPYFPTCLVFLFPWLLSGKGFPGPGECEGEQCHCCQSYGK